MDIGLNIKKKKEIDCSEQRLFEDPGEKLSSGPNTNNIF